MSERMSVGGVEDRKMKRKLEEVEDEEEQETEHFLSLSLCNNADMSKPLTVASNGGFGKKSGKGKEFGCRYCQKKFRSSQALGGHQNAHRRERVIIKMEKELSMGTYGHPHLCSCSSIITESNLPFPFRTASSASDSPFNHHFHRHGIGIGTDHHRRCHVLNWTNGYGHPQGLPKPSLTFGMNSSENANLVGKKPTSSSGLDLSLRL